MDDMYVAYIKMAAAIGAAFAMGIGAIGPSLGQGRIGATACENIGKYPNMAPAIRTLMLIGMGIVETTSIYCFVVAILLIFRN